MRQIRNGIPTAEEEDLKFSQWRVQISPILLYGDFVVIGRMTDYNSVGIWSPKYFTMQQVIRLKGGTKMAKAPIVESHSKILTGMLDVENMTMDFEELGETKLKELLEPFDGSEVTITIKLTNKIS